MQVIEIIPLLVAVLLSRLALDLTKQAYHDTSGSLFRNEKWLRDVGAMLLVYLYTALWALLFAIPGIVKVYSYSMTRYTIYFS